MDRLFQILLHLYLKELINVNIGYQNDPKNLALMMDLINAIEFIR